MREVNYLGHLKDQTKKPSSETLKVQEEGKQLIKRMKSINIMIPENTKMLAYKAMSHFGVETEEIFPLKY